MSKKKVVLEFSSAEERDRWFATINSDPEYFDALYQLGFDISAKGITNTCNQDATRKGFFPLKDFTPKNINYVLKAFYGLNLIEDEGEDEGDQEELEAEDPLVSVDDGHATNLSPSDSDCDSVDDRELDEFLDGPIADAEPDVALHMASCHDAEPLLLRPNRSSSMIEARRDKVAAISLFRSQIRAEWSASPLKLFAPDDRGCAAHARDAVLCLRGKGVRYPDAGDLFPLMALGVEGSSTGVASVEIKSSAK
jgi:hypothetical protein